jgi:hypothetical protein
MDRGVRFAYSQGTGSAAMTKRAAAEKQRSRLVTVVMHGAIDPGGWSALFKDQKQKSFKRLIDTCKKFLVMMVVSIDLKDRVEGWMG